MVISIIAILVSILVPALVSVLQQSYATATAAELNSVRAACESYYATFDAYPGLFPEADIAAGDVQPNGGSAGNLATALTGTQNMLLSLMGPAYNSTTGFSGSQTYATVSDLAPGGGTFYVPYVGSSPITFGSGPIDYSNGGVQKTAFFSPPLE